MLDYLLDPDLPAHPNAPYLLQFSPQTAVSPTLAFITIKNRTAVSYPNLTIFSFWCLVVSFIIYSVPAGGTRKNNMVKFTLRVDNDELITQFDELAREHGMTRTALIVQLMEDALNAGYIPMRSGEGFRAITGSGAEVSLTRYEKHVSSGKHGLLTDDQEIAFSQAHQAASPKHGSQWVIARKTLENAGFKVFKL
ncbi:MAG: hypothetical protein GY943_02075 [Chloroflexi bacterium]|nr:hypothetical protein [Chloroflexota bacterium]